MDRRALALIGVALVAGALWYWRSLPANYDECVLNEMRGRDRVMHATVAKVCARRFGKRVQVYDTSKVVWHGDALSAEVTYTGQDYVLTDGVFRLSSKSCKDSTDQDYSPEMDGVALTAGGPIVVFLAGAAGKNPMCMTTVKLFGTYK